MEKKACNTCLIEKPLIDFHFNNVSKTYQKYCKICNKEKCKKYYIDNKDRLTKRNKDYYENNKESVLEMSKIYYENNLEKYKERGKKRYESNKEKFKVTNRDYYVKNKDKIIEGNRVRNNKRRKEDPLFRMSNNVRRVILASLKRFGYTKRSRTYKILGCTFEELVEHLENNKYGFKISDTNLDIDHIIPVSSDKTEEGLVRLNHHTNLQLLPSVYNRDIKSNKPFNREHFEDWLKQQNPS